MSETFGQGRCPVVLLGEGGPPSLVSCQGQPLKLLWKLGKARPSCNGGRGLSPLSWPSP